MNFLKTLEKQFTKLCTPSQFYLVFSIFAVIIMLLQNSNDTRKYCVGNYSCKLPFSNVLLFVMKLLFILFWTIVLDSLCKNGYTNLAWVIILLPFILMGLIIVTPFLLFVVNKL